MQGLQKALSGSPSLSETVDAWGADTVSPSRVPKPHTSHSQEPHQQPTRVHLCPVL